MFNTYFTKLTFKGQKYEIGIYVHKHGGYDLELRTKNRMSGNDFQALKNYLEEEGYIDQAKEYQFSH